MSRQLLLRVVPIALASASLASCRSPLDGDATASLRESVLDAIRQDLAAESDTSEPVEVERIASDLDLSVERIAELEQLSGAASYEDQPMPLGQDLLGDDGYEEVGISLEDAVASAVRNNLRTQAARLEPAIRAEDAIAADAVFDWTLFASGEYNRNDNPSAVPVVGGVPVGTGVVKNENSFGTLGVDKQTRYGGLVTISTTADVFNNQSEGFERFPDPARTADLDLVLSQPLLQGFGYDVNMAQVYLAQNSTESGVELLRRNLMDTITDVETAYWRLYLARQELLIRQRLLERGIQTRDALVGRLGFDVTQAQVADAVATVEFRRADLTRTRNFVRRRSDEFKALLNDPNYPLADERLLAPTEVPLDEAIQFSLLDAITSGITSRPEVRLAEIDIRDADIRRLVAKNATLPLLNLDARFNATGLDDDLSDAYSNAFQDDYYDSGLGLRFEQPIGNRGPEAALRRARLQRVQAVTLYRASVEEVILDIKTALRNVATSYQLIEQTHVSRLAAAENLRSLQAEEETIRSLTPEFLDLKLRRQENLALAEFQEVQALTDYAASLADLYRAMGVTLERNNVSVDTSTSIDDLETQSGY
jgi:outer membrane protein TolC